MAKRLVISERHIPFRNPLWTLITIGLLTDRLIGPTVPVWIWGAYGMFCALVLVAFFAHKNDEIQKVPLDFGGED